MGDGDLNQVVGMRAILNYSKFEVGHVVAVLERDQLPELWDEMNIVVCGRLCKEFHVEAAHRANNYAPVSNQQHHNPCPKPPAPVSE